MQQANGRGTNPTLGQNLLVLLVDSLAVALYVAVAYLIAKPFFQVHWSLGVIYLIPLIWGYYLFFVAPLAEDGQTVGQKAREIVTYRKDGKEFVKEGSTGGIGYAKSTLLWLVTRTLVPVLALWVLYTNFSYTNLVLVLIIYLISLVVFAYLEDSLFGIYKVVYAFEPKAESKVVRGYFKKKGIGCPQLPGHALIIPFVLLVGGIFLVTYGAAKYQVSPPAGLTAMIVGVLAIILSQGLLAVKSWARWGGVIFLVIAAVVTWLYNYSPTQAYVTAIVALLFVLDLALDPYVANAFRK
ncbi:MAG TPA: hypothetical protein ENK07_11590 [Bacteroidetes bacterium]|nr:hypothetical protein [Bacteroidota bacterium]